MIKFKFKLDPVLKMRKLKEDICKQEVGVIQSSIEELRNKINEINENIHKVKLSQEKIYTQGFTAKELNTFPIFFEQQKKIILNLEEEIKKLEHKLGEKLKELATLRGDVKVLQNMHDKELTQFKKDYNKKIEQDIEELNMIRNRFGK